MYGKFHVYLFIYLLACACRYVCVLYPHCLLPCSTFDFNVFIGYLRRIRKTRVRNIFLCNNKINPRSILDSGVESLHNRTFSVSRMKFLSMRIEACSSVRALVYRPNELSHCRFEEFHSRRSFYVTTLLIRASHGLVYPATICFCRYFTRPALLRLSSWYLSFVVLYFQTISTVDFSKGERVTSSFIFLSLKHFRKLPPYVCARHCLSLNKKITAFSFTR